MLILNKYQLLNEVIGEYAESFITKYIKNDYSFNQRQIENLMLAVFDYQQQIKNKCHRNYKSFVPLLRSQMLHALTKFKRTF